MKIFIIVGTRPEYIKLAPVYLEFQSLNKLADNEDAENAEIRVQQQSSKGTVAERTSSRLRRTNDRSALGVYEILSPLYFFHSRYLKPHHDY